MGTRPEVAERVREALASIDSLAIKPMFGEYGIYVDGKVVGSICDNQLFVKLSDGAKAHTEGFEMLPPHPGAKPSVLIPESRWSDHDWLATVYFDCAASLPAPKPKKSKP